MFLEFKNRKPLSVFHFQIAASPLCYYVSPIQPTALLQLYGHEPVVSG